MRQDEADLITQIKAVGVKRAKEIFGFLSFWESPSESEEEEVPPSGISKKRMTQLTLVGEAVLESFPKIGRKPGQVNPNSVLQKVTRAVHELLTKRGPMMRSEILIHVVQVTGLTGSQVASTSSSVKGLDRYNGRWSLQAVKKAA